MILVINVCYEKLHYYEFVKPVEDILRRRGLDFMTKHYMRVTNNDLEQSRRIIICGTSLKDNHFLDDVEKFTWIKEMDKPVLGICAGMQLMGLLFNGELKQKTEIGFYDEFFESYLGLKKRERVYHLHTNYVDFAQLGEFQVFSKGSIPQAVKHIEKPLYGVLFHPEVRQKSLFWEFCSI